MTKRMSFLFALLSTVPVALMAQGPAPTNTDKMAAGASNPIATSQARMYKMLSGVIIAAAEKVPEEDYSFKPTPDVRSFGQLVGHLADAQYYFCGLASGETKSSGGVEKNKTAKADLVAALKEAVSFCTDAYNGMTDAKGSETVKFMGVDFARLAVLAANTAHDYEHYGNMATYMRLKGIVPPSSEKSDSGRK